MKREITPEIIKEYKDIVQQRELEPETRKKYLIDVEKLKDYLAGAELTQEKLNAYPDWLLVEKKYKKRSINTIVVSTRKFCQAMGWDDLVINGYTLDQEERKTKDKYISRTDYQSLVTKADELGKKWLALMLQTLCHMDIHYSEMSELTVEAVKAGCVEVVRRHKIVQIRIPHYLRENYLKYIRQEGIVTGSVFTTSGGKVPHRANTWREIKNLCKEAGLDEDQITLQKFRMPLVADYYPFYPV